jgi:hypothetical protein
MCNPKWGQIKPSSELIIDARKEGQVRVVCDVTTRHGSDAPQERRYDVFPVVLPLEAGTRHRAQVDVTCLGEAANVTITARVTGADSRGPDVCPMKVDADHPYASEVIRAEAKNA